MERVYILKNRPNGDASPITAEQVEVLVKEQGTQELEVVQGYYNGTNFYTDAGFTTLITPDETKLYISKNGNLSYRYEVGYVAVGSGSDIIEVANLAALPATGEVAKIYITIDTNLQYRWSGSAYVQIGAEKPFEIIDVVESAVAIDSNMTLLKEYNLGKLSGFKQIDLKVLFKRVGSISSDMRIITYLIREDESEGGQLGFDYYSGVNVTHSFFKRTITLREINNQIEYYSKDSGSSTDENTFGDNTVLNGVNFNFNWKIRILSTSPNFKTYHTNIIKR